MLKLSFLALFSCIVSVILPSAPAASPLPTFTCDIGKHAGLIRNGRQVGEQIYYGDGFIAFSANPKPNEKLGEVKTGSGERYSDGKLSFHAKGDLGLLIVANGPAFSCKATKSGVIANAKSLVTIVRAGPNVKSKRLGRLALNAPIQLIGETGEYFNKYQWYKIRYGAGQEGFAWGGTMCVETELSGILIGCAKHLKNDVVATKKPNVSVAGKSVFGSLIREAPDTKSKLLYKIPHGAGLEVVRETGGFLDTWQWVEVSVSGKGTGYAWGGTVCTIDTKLVGVHFGCQ